MSDDKQKRKQQIYDIIEKIRKDTNMSRGAKERAIKAAYDALANLE